MTAREFARAQESEPNSAPRVWRTSSGLTKATFVELKDGAVQLQRQDGSTVSIAIERLSEADQEFVKSRAGGDKTAHDAPPIKPGVGGGTSEIESKCQDLCEQITKGYKGKEAGGKATIAVVEFSDLSGGVTDFGRLLSEELITKLFATGKYKVIERLHLNKAIAEHKLQWQGIVDPKSAKELGRILGADAIVSGTIATVGNSLRVNARLFSTETGELLSVAAVTVVKDAVKDLLGKTGGEGEEPITPPTKMSIKEATVAGKHYIGTLTWNEHRQRILVNFIEQDGFLIRAEVSNPDSPKQKRVFAGELLADAKPEQDSSIYPIQMSSVGENNYDAMDGDNYQFYCYVGLPLKLRLTDTGLEGTSKDRTIHLKPGTATVRSPKDPAGSRPSLGSRRTHK